MRWDALKLYSILPYYQLNFLIANLNMLKSLKLMFGEEEYEVLLIPSILSFKEESNEKEVQFCLNISINKKSYEIPYLLKYYQIVQREGGCIYKKGRYKLIHNSKIEKDENLNKLIQLLLLIDAHGHPWTLCEISEYEFKNVDLNSFFFIGEPNIWVKCNYGIFNEYQRGEVISDSLNSLNCIGCIEERNEDRIIVGHQLIYIRPLNFICSNFCYISVVSKKNEKDYYEVNIYPQGTKIFEGLYSACYEKLTNKSEFRKLSNKISDLNYRLNYDDSYDVRNWNQEDINSAIFGDSEYENIYDPE